MNRTSYFLTLIFSILIGSQSFAQSAYVLDDFRGTFWGTPIDSFYRDGEKRTFKPTDAVGIPNTFTMVDDDLFIGSVKLSNIYYVFSTDDKFDRLVFEGVSNQSYKEMKYILITKFGQPEVKEINDKLQYSWNIDGVRLYLQFDTENDVFTVDFYSNYELNESRKKNRSVADF